MQDFHCIIRNAELYLPVNLEQRMEIQAEIDVVENLYKQAKYIRTQIKSDPHKAKAAANWEIKLGEELARLRSLIAPLPGLERTEHAA
jgi:hypothetical protein